MPAHHDLCFQQIPYFFKNQKQDFIFSTTEIRIITFSLPPRPRASFCCVDGELVNCGVCSPYNGKKAGLCLRLLIKNEVHFHSLRTFLTPSLRGFP